MKIRANATWMSVHARRKQQKSADRRIHLHNAFSSGCRDDLFLGKEDKNCAVTALEWLHKGNTFSESMKYEIKNILIICFSLALTAGAKS
jgi:hypothetical protein